VSIFVLAADILLGDFGVARVLTDSIQMAVTMIGTPYYLSPELCESKPYVIYFHIEICVNISSYDYKSDIWSLGCVLYEMTTLKHAFDARDMCALVMKIIKGDYPPIPEHYSDNLRNLIADMLNKDAAQRPSIISILQLPFIMESMKSFLATTMARAGEQSPMIAPMRSPSKMMRAALEYQETITEMQEKLQMEEHEKERV